MWGNIPEEMRKRQQWAVADKEEKAPRNPVTLQYAKVDDSSTWGSFEQAVQAAEAKGWGVGYILSPDDPFTIIDLDNKLDSPASAEEITRQQKIIEAFSSYTEKSVSGRGHHIVVRGMVPKGVRRGHVEVYSDARFMLCTGDVVLPFPVVARQDLLDTLFHEMGGNLNGTAKVQVDDQEAKDSDEQILQWAMNADNAANFRPLWEGVWEGKYGSQSEADMALMSMLRFYTKNVDQLFRLFRQSELGKREKALKNDTYLTHTLNRVVQSEPPPVDLSKLRMPKPPSVEPTPPSPAPRPTPPSEITYPPGLIGELADYIHQSSIRPVREIGLVGALAFAAGICARSYNISGVGLNQYLILLAKTGVGKDGAASGIDALMSAIRPQMPMIDNILGPAAFASGQAVVRALDQHPCFMALLGEFGITLQQLSNPKANNAETMLKKVLLDLYNKSGFNRILRPSVYSDKEKNTTMVLSPNLTILGESTPDTFFAGLSHQHIAEGLVPRFCVVEYKGPRPPRNYDGGFPPPPDLVSKVVELFRVSYQIQQNSAGIHIEMDGDAARLLDEFDQEADDRINSADDNAEAELWNRAHLKALKVGGLISVGMNFDAPVISGEVAQWSIDFVRRDIHTMEARFRSADIGAGELPQEAAIRRAIEDYLHMAPSKRKTYTQQERLSEVNGVVPFSYLRRRLRVLDTFNDGRRRSADNIGAALQELVNAEILIEVPAAQALQELGTRAKVFALGPSY